MSAHSRGSLTVNKSEYLNYERKESERVRLHIKISIVYKNTNTNLFSKNHDAKTVEAATATTK